MTGISLFFYLVFLVGMLCIFGLITYKQGRPHRAYMEGLRQQEERERRHQFKAWLGEVHKILSAYRCTDESEWRNYFDDGLTPEGAVSEETQWWEDEP